MRTHKIVFDCPSSEKCDIFWDFISDYLVDMTHWFCGLDGAGDDTPETCLIYRGYIRNCRITVEFDRQKMFYDETNEQIHDIFSRFIKDGTVSKIQVLKIWDKIED